MSSPFEQVGFNMTPQFQTMPAFPPVAQPFPQPMPAYAPNQVSFATNPVAPSMPQPALQSQPSDDQFVRQSNSIDIDILKAEIKEELRKEMEAEKAAEQKAEAKKKAKKGPIRAIKDFIGTVKKFNTTAAEYVKGTFKGLASGAIIGTAAYGAFSLAKKPGMAKAFGVLGVVGALGVNLWKASLNANAQRSVIDHSWGESTPIVNK